MIIYVCFSYSNNIDLILVVVIVSVIIYVCFSFSDYIHLFLVIVLVIIYICF